MIIHAYIGIAEELGDSNFIILPEKIFNNNINVGWETTYAQVAKDLSSQGFDIILSTNPKVIKHVAAIADETPVVILPANELKDKWIAMLQKRIDKTGKYQDKLNYVRASHKWDSDIPASLAAAHNGKCQVTILHSLTDHLDEVVYEVVYTTMKLGRAKNNEPTREAMV